MSTYHELPSISLLVAGIHCTPTTGPRVGNGIGAVRPLGRSTVKLAGMTGTVSTCWQHSTMSVQLANGIVDTTSLPCSRTASMAAGAAVIPGAGTAGAGFPVTWKAAASAMRAIEACIVVGRRTVHG